MSGDKIRFTETAGDVTVYATGFELARTTPGGGWDIRVNGQLVSLDGIIDTLTRLRETLDSMKVPDGGQ